MGLSKTGSKTRFDIQITRKLGDAMSASRSFAKRITYNISRVAAQLTAVLLFRMRCEGRDLIPKEGGILVCSNHQSLLDPVLVGLGCDRRMNYLARDTLFRSPAFGWLIRWYDAIPIQRDGFGIAGIKETLKRLKRGEMVLIFPEGTRTLDGTIAPLKPGFCSLARRGKVSLLPVGLAGAYEVWPRGSKFPRRGTIRLRFGDPITPTEVAAMSDEELIDCLQSRISECFEMSRKSISGGDAAETLTESSTEGK